MFGSDLAKLYNVETKYLNRQVKRNYEQFHEIDFMFQLTKKELENLEEYFNLTTMTFKETVKYFVSK